MNSNKQPFWKDEPETYFYFNKNQRARPSYFYVSIGIRVIILFIGIYALLSYPLAMWLWIFVYGLPQALRVYMIFRKKGHKQSIAEIQKLARERIGASHIGSATHVAGHPLLQRDQTVVLALVGDQLNIYNYKNPTPLDTIPLSNIQTIHTVSYDDERVPHIDTIDSVAQALQLTFLWHDQHCTCLFRRMRKMKPIDWYQAVQQVRLQSGLSK